MPGRGNNSRGRGRGGANYKPPQRNESVHDRLGRMPVYTKPNDRNLKKYKFVRPTCVSSSVVSLPGEAKVKLLSKNFLRSYYNIFDQAGRANLGSLYNADAYFSFSSTFQMPPPTQFGRNLLEVRDPENRWNLLVKGNNQIAAQLACFSPTEHIVNCLSCDVPFYMSNPMYVVSMHIIVTGVFKDTSQTTSPLRAFSRVFILKQVSVDRQGEPVYEIFNDLFMLQVPTPEQIKRYHHDASVSKRLAANQHERSSNSQTSDRSLKVQEEMISSIMNKTRMNKAGSEQLLQENNWNENKSMEVFNALYASNKIPQEFFTN